MIISIASGKGGTGKTTFATNLSLAAAGRGDRVTLMDCDVEEPNSHIFIKPEITATEKVHVQCPMVIEEKCTGCGKCGEVCQFSAIVVINKKVLTFPELCHACGGCFEFCPEGAIMEQPREVGELQTGKSRGVDFVHGRLRVGEAMSPPLIREVKKRLEPDAINIIDSPPGTSCPVIESIKGSDFVLLVTEPTPFGLNDLKLAVEMVRTLGIPFAVGINRSDTGNSGVLDYCSEESIDVFVEVPHDRNVAEAYSRGEIAYDVVPEYAGIFIELLEKIEKAGKAGAER
ncbi:MAG TPA: ATP-binding protein [bacterium]|nr:ATP-binding protein [bacterium]